MRQTLAAIASTITAAVFLTVAGGTTHGADKTGPWLNVREYGASGSRFQTTGRTEAGSNQVTVSDVGDFQVGQGVTISKCNVDYGSPRIYDPGEMYKNHRVKDEFELRGFNGKGTGWRTFVVTIDGENPATCRWSNDCGKTWPQMQLPITGDWQPLSDGVEIKFSAKDYWKRGHLITFHARDRLISRIMALDGKILTLRDAVPQAATDAVIRHHDQAALAAALRAAIREQRNLFIPAGHYRLSEGLTIQDASITVAGQSMEHTVLDLSEGAGCCFRTRGGRHVILRDLRLVGNSGFKEYPLWFRRVDGSRYWAMNLKPSRALIVSGTESVLVENVHASNMSGECFYSQGPGRSGTRPEPKQRTKQWTLLRCVVTDCLFNAFNNNDYSENTNILYCRVDGASNFWEGPSRFYRVIGNHVRNCHHYGTFGNTQHRYRHFNQLGVGQAIVADNVFEGLEKGPNEKDSRGGGPNVVTPATQVIIRNNLFVNFSSGTALSLDRCSSRDGYLPRHVTITGNIIDLTHEANRQANPRHGIRIQTSGVTVSDNQIYVRGEVDPAVTGIFVGGHVFDLTIHDNLIKNCGVGIMTQPSTAQVTEVLGTDTFKADRNLPKEWEKSHLYRGWHLHWKSGVNAGAKAEFDGFDPIALVFRLKDPTLMTAGDAFAFYPGQAHWDLHNNTITGCTRPVTLEVYGSDTTLFRDNIITRGRATGVEAAVVQKGNVAVTGNRIVGFDEEDAIAIAVKPGPTGKTWDKKCHDNTIVDCTGGVAVTKE